ncbi:hypothetical protein F442_01351 [Phytophthora nicotianae P10297]|uniref:Uncharacterized protein n=1 Tax=Phytophthora nicotianae P10297 TaxID=1317064 RepID=W3A3L6_PHYNI|nr:hypothetical protein F442_01351 [Phytophthora nicotianae P10297]
MARGSELSGMGLANGPGNAAAERWQCRGEKHRSLYARLSVSCQDPRGSGSEWEYHRRWVDAAIAQRRIGFFGAWSIWNGRTKICVISDVDKMKRGTVSRVCGGSR